MIKKLILSILAGFFGVATNPLILTAADTVSVAGLNPSGIVETVPLPEPEPEPEPEPVYVASYASRLAAPAAGSAYVAQYVAPQINYTVTAYSGGITLDPGGDIYKTGNLIYAHNSAGLLGNLGSLGVGSNFSVTEGGVVTTYQVARVIRYEKNGDYLQLNGQGNYMKAVLNAIDKDTMAHYSIALMTCAGQPLGGGDATHRLVVFANAV